MAEETAHAQRVGTLRSKPNERKSEKAVGNEVGKASGGKSRVPLGVHGIVSVFSR